MTRATLLVTIATNGNLNRSQAEAVFDLYLSWKVRAIRYNAHDGFTVTHGAFLDYEPIRRALFAIRERESVNRTVRSLTIAEMERARGSRITRCGP